jgi:methionyl-tRNA synthetase
MLIADPSNMAVSASLNQAVFYFTESVRITGILLQPIMPDKMAELLDSLGVAQDRRTFQHAALGADESYGVDPAVLAERGVAGKHPRPTETLFPPLPGIDGDQPGFSRKKSRGNLMYRTVRNLDSWKGPLEKAE